MAAYYPVMVLVPEALLPTPVPSPRECDKEDSVPLMSPELCMQIIKSPYLSAARRRQNMDGGIEKLKVHAKSRIAPESPEMAPLSPADDLVSEEPLLPPQQPTFDDEIADCLPGVAGARQSKEYKKLRRKISEIDDLLRANIQLDYCQRAKVDRRAKYVDMIRAILKGGVAESSDDESCEMVIEDPIPDEPQDTIHKAEIQEETTVASTPVEPVTPEIPSIVVRKKSQPKKLQRKIVAVKQKPKNNDQSELRREIDSMTTIQKSWFTQLREFFCMLISWIVRLFSVYINILV